MSATSAAAACSGRSSSSPTAPPRQVFDPALKLNERVKAEGIARGLATYPMGGTIDGKQGDHVIIAPPYIVTAADIDTIVERLGDAVDAALVSSLCEAFASLRSPLDGTAISATFRAMRNFSELTEREILALAIANEEEDGRIYLDIAEGLRAEYPGSAKVFTEMAGEEGDHRRRLLDVYRGKFGEHIPLIRRQDVRGFIQHKPVWQMDPLNLNAVRNLAEEHGDRNPGLLPPRRRRAARTSRSASCSAIWPMPRSSTSIAPTSWSRRTCPPTCAGTRTRTPASPSSCA